MSSEAARHEAALDRDPSRAHWMELFFALIFVALVGQVLVSGCLIAEAAR